MEPLLRITWPHSAKTLNDSVADHVSGGSTINGYAHRLVGGTKHSSNVCLDLDNLLPYDIGTKFTSLLDKYDHMFDPNIKGYNGAEGPFKARVNMGPVEPPSRKAAYRSMPVTS